MSVSHPSSAAGAVGVVQLPKPAAQLDTQSLFSQATVTVPVELQARLHVPQSCVSVLKSDSQPLLSIPSQLPKLVAQTWSLHSPARHDSVAFARSHGLLQKPQWASDVLMS